MSNTLVILGSQPIHLEDGIPVVTKKFLSGMHKYAESWNGKVKAVLNLVDNNPALDNTRVTNDLPFQIIPTHFGSQDMYDAIAGASVVLGGPHHLLHGVPKRMKAMNIPYVACTEYTIRTRIQQIQQQSISPLRKFKRSLFEVVEEGRNLLDMWHSVGVQCNGTPTFDLYSKVNDNSMLFFDNRVSRLRMPSFESLSMKLLRKKDQPLHLGYSGRWARIKGVHHLPLMGRRLLDLGKRDWKLSLCGGGDLESELRRDIEKLGLQDHVFLKGNMDFDSELVPFIQSEVDLFIAPHLQGDPSCTYMETLACGVPIIGYANEAWSGMVDKYRAGWLTNIGDYLGIANLIHELDRDAIARESVKALSVAYDHSFEATFLNRVGHLRQCATASLAR